MTIENNSNNNAPYKTALPHYYTTQEASDRLGYANNSYLGKQCASGAIFAYKVGNTWLIPEKQVEDLEKQGVNGKGARGQSRG